MLKVLSSGRKQQSNWNSVPKNVRQILDGVMLGDGSIHRCKRDYFCLRQAGNHVSWVEDIAFLLRSYNPVRKMALVIDVVDSHWVYFLRKAGIKRWVCDCKDFLIRRIALGRHCKHIRYAKERI